MSRMQVHLNKFLILIKSTLVKYCRFYDVAISINTKIDLEGSSYITEVSGVNLGLGDFRSLSSNGVVVPEVLSLFFVQALNNFRP